MATPRDTTRPYPLQRGAPATPRAAIDALEAVRTPGDIRSAVEQGSSGTGGSIGVGVIGGGGIGGRAGLALDDGEIMPSRLRALQRVEAPMPSPRASVLATPAVRLKPDAVLTGSREALGMSAVPIDGDATAPYQTTAAAVSVSRAATHGLAVVEAARAVGVAEREAARAARLRQRDSTEEVRQRRQAARAVFPHVPLTLSLPCSTHYRRCSSSGRLLSSSCSTTRSLSSACVARHAPSCSPSRHQSNKARQRRPIKALV